MFGWGGVALVGIFGLSALACLLVAARERRRQGGLGRSFAGFLALTGVWAAVEAVRIGIGGLGPKRALYTVGLVLGLTTVVAWLRFCAEFAGRRPGRTVWGVVWTVWAAGVAVKLTNPLHGRYFAARMRSTPFEHMAVQPGALHWVVTALAYVGAFAGLYVVAESVVASRNARGRLTAGAVLLSPLDATTRLLLVAAAPPLIVVATALSVGIGMAFPRFQAVNVTRSVKTVIPSVLAFLLFTLHLLATTASAVIVYDEASRGLAAFVLTWLLPFGLGVDPGTLSGIAAVALAVLVVLPAASYRYAVRRFDGYTMS